jgi:hypothetical protein
MSKSIAFGLALVAGFILFMLDGLQGRFGSASMSGRSTWVATAQAAAVCPVPQLASLARPWRVTSARCSTEACTRTHLAVGDKVTFARDLSGEENFSMQVTPAVPAAVTVRTAGYALRADGIGNVRGPVVLDHSVLDGSVLQTHWLIVKLRAVAADAEGNCRPQVRLQVCDVEPAPGSLFCGDQQHRGDVHLDP